MKCRKRFCRFYLYEQSRSCLSLSFFIYCLRIIHFLNVFEWIGPKIVMFVKMVCTSGVFLLKVDMKCLVAPFVCFPTDVWLGVCYHNPCCFFGCLRRIEPSVPLPQWKQDWSSNCGNILQAVLAIVRRLISWRNRVRPRYVYGCLKICILLTKAVFAWLVSFFSCRVSLQLNFTLRCTIKFLGRKTTVRSYLYIENSITEQDVHFHQSYFIQNPFFALLFVITLTLFFKLTFIWAHYTTSLTVSKLNSSPKRPLAWLEIDWLN